MANNMNQSEQEQFFRFNNFEHARKLGYGGLCLPIGHKDLKYSKGSKIKPEMSHKVPAMSGSRGYTGLTDWRIAPPTCDGDIRNYDTFERKDGCGIGFRGMDKIVAVDVDSERKDFLEKIVTLS